MYLELKSFSIKNIKKITNIKSNKNKFAEIENSISLQEKKANELIYKMEEQLKNAATAIKIKDIFDKYKIELMDIINVKTEYKNCSNVFTLENINNFKIDNLFKFLESHLKNNSYSITKKDITNYNLFVEIITNFKELKDMYSREVDIEI